MRIDLESLNCVYFSLRSYPIELNDNLLETARSQFRARRDGSQDRQAIFASRYVRSGVTHHSVGTLEWFNEEAKELQIGMYFVSERYSPLLPWQRPRVRAFRHFMREVVSQFGSLEIMTLALFRYPKKYRSLIALPAPLIAQPGVDGITHIQSADFVRMEDDKQLFAISITGDEDSIDHDVRFLATAPLESLEIRAMLREAVSISSQLVSIDADREKVHAEEG